MKAVRITSAITGHLGARRTWDAKATGDHVRFKLSREPLFIEVP
jgi:hypothetical protein